MEQPLELAVILSPPPSDVPSHTLASITVQCDALGLNHSRAFFPDLLTDEEHTDLRWYLEEYWKWPYEQFEVRGRQVEALLPDIGRRLYEAAFGSIKDDQAFQVWHSQEDALRQITIISDIPRVLSLPWELLHDEREFLVFHTPQPISIVRRLAQQEQPAPPTPFEPPLRILLVTPRPVDVGFVDPRSIARELVTEMQSQIEAGTIEIEFLFPPTFKELRVRLNDRQRPIYVLHFDGHGAFDETTKQGLLAFETDGEWHNLVKASDLRKVLHQSGVRLVVLTACQSAVSMEDDALGSLAAQLIQSDDGVDAVVAMGASILTISATRYVEAFYRALAKGEPAQVAQERARHALHDNPYRHPYRRRQDEEGLPIELYDWWIPQFYQQRPLLLQPNPSVRIAKTDSEASSPRQSGGLPGEPRYGFSGRALELLQLERWLRRGKMVVIHGFGGIGKTALVREAAIWLMRIQRYGGACFVSFEHGGDATTLLRALGHLLGIYDSEYDSNDLTSALARLIPVLKERPILIVADNMESLLPNGEAPLEATTRTQLWDVLLELARTGAGVLLTSSDTAFGDERLMPGRKVAHLALRGLHPEDAYMFASRLLDKLGIDHVRAPYPDLRDLLIQLDHHPLAIQLVLPTLGQEPLSKIRADFATLLPKFVDDKEAGRNRSLSASLEYSLQRLSKAQQALLSRLTVFEGGAREEDLLAIIQIPEQDWKELRARLEQTSLLVVERVDQGIPSPFLRFHPVLIPYLRSQTGEEDAEMQARYAHRYAAVIEEMYHEDKLNGLPALRMLAWLELPNLMRALEFLLEAEELETAFTMAVHVAWFLDCLDLQKKREELQQRISRVSRDIHLSGTLTQAEWPNEISSVEHELDRGNLQVASAHIALLLSRIEAQPKGTPLGIGSFPHCIILALQAKYLQKSGQLIAAENRLYQALAVLDALVEQEPGTYTQRFRAEQGILLTELGDVLCNQGKYTQARSVLEKVVQDSKQQGNNRLEAMALYRLAELALMRQEFSKAKSYFEEAGSIFSVLGERSTVASAWGQLSRVALAQNDGVEAERCARKSLMLSEQLGDEKKTAANYFQLAAIAGRAGRSAEAEGWYKRTLELYERVDSGSPAHAECLSSFASFLVAEVQADRASLERLDEARNHAEQAQITQETGDASSGGWETLHILAVIASMQRQEEVAKKYFRRERETYAAFEGNRYHMYQQLEAVIAAVSEAVEGDAQMQAGVEELLSAFKKNAANQRLIEPIQRILSGERDWHSLAEGLDRDSALVVLLILERIASPTYTSITKLADITLVTSQELLALLPPSLREVVERDDGLVFQTLLETLPAQERQAVLAIVHQVRIKQEEELQEIRTGTGIAHIPEWLPQAIAAAAENIDQRHQVEEVLAVIGPKALPLMYAVQRIWAGERDNTAVTMELDVQDKALVYQVLEILSEATSEDEVPIGTERRETLTHAEWLNEIELAEEDLKRENLQDAYARFSSLLERIEALPESASLGPGSFEHCTTLIHLGHCLSQGRQPAAAEHYLRKALTIIELLLKQHPNQILIYQHSVILASLGDVLHPLGRYRDAQAMYEKALELAKGQGNLPQQGALLSLLGSFALERGEYTKARWYYIGALELASALGEKDIEAKIRHDLSLVARGLQEWTEAERYVRESLAINEQLGDEVDAILLRVKSLIHLADLILEEVRMNHALMARLVEARNYAERAWSIAENYEEPSRKRKSLQLLAEIAEMEGRTEAVRDYRRRERDLFLAFQGNREDIDRQYGQLIADIVSAAQGGMQARTKVESALPQLESEGFHIAAAVHNIWKGLRNWPSLVEDLNGRDALIIQLVLERLESTEAQAKTLEQSFASLPPSLLEAWGRGEFKQSQAAFEALSPQEQEVAMETMFSLLETFSPEQWQAAMDAVRSLGLPPEELQEAMEAMHSFREQVKEGGEELNVLNTDALLQEFEPLLQTIAAVAVGEAGQRSKIEGVLNDLETKGWHLKDAVQRIWDGEGDATVLTGGLGQEEAALVWRILEIVAEKEFEPLLQAIAEAIRNPDQRSELEAELVDLKEEGWHLRVAVQRIWAGERSEIALTEALDEQEKALVQRILEIIAGASSS